MPLPITPPSSLTAAGFKAANVPGSPQANAIAPPSSKPVNAVPTVNNPTPQGAQPDKFTPDGAKNNPLLSVATGPAAVTTSDPITAPEKEAKDKQMQADYEEIQRLTRQKAISDLRASLTPAGGAPTPPNEVKTYEDLRKGQGIVDIESHLNNILAQKAELQGKLTTAKLGEPEGNSQGFANARIGEAERNTMARQDFLTREETAIRNDLTYRSNYVSEVMKLTQTDYANAKASFDDAYGKNVQAQTLWNTQADRETNQASAYLNTVGKMIQDSGKQWKDISPEMKADIGISETKAGWPPGTMETFSRSKPKADVIATIQGIDPNTQQKFVTFFSRNPDTGQIEQSKVYGAGVSATPQEMGQGGTNINIGSTPPDSSTYKPIYGNLKMQQKLEQEFRGVLVKEMSNRSGGLGMQDAKVNQAIHLRALLDQFKDPKTGEYKVPASQYTELAIGLANLVSGQNTAGEGIVNDIKQKTAKGDINGAISYILGIPMAASTAAMFQNLSDSIDRQGKVSQSIRDQDIEFLHGLAPSDLDPARVKSISGTLLKDFKDSKGQSSRADDPFSPGKVVSYRGGNYTVGADGHTLTKIK